MAESLEEFVEDFSGAPYELHEFAENAVDIEDCSDLVEAAQNYLNAKEAFEVALESVGVEIG